MPTFLYLRISENNIERSELFETHEKALDAMLKDVKKHWDSNYDSDEFSWDDVVQSLNHDNEFTDDSLEFSITKQGGYSRMDNDENIDWYILPIKSGQTTGQLAW